VDEPAAYEADRRERDRAMVLAGRREAARSALLGEVRLLVRPTDSRVLFPFLGGAPRHVPREEWYPG